MPIDKTRQSLEMGSNLEGIISLTGMDEIRDKLIALNDGLSGKILNAAVDAGAQAYKREIQSAVNSISRDARVVITERRQRGLAVTAAQRSLLIGIEKKSGYHLYWYDKGRKGQAKRPFFESSIESAEALALKAAQDVVAEEIEKISNK